MKLLERMQRDNARFVDAGLVRFSRQLHYLLAQLTTDSARLVVRGNVELNGFESWRLLGMRFSLPRTAPDISLLTKVLEFSFRPDHFEQDYSSEWETLKARYEKQTGAALPDNILVATLLNRTTGLLQQHLKLNVRTMDSYDTILPVEVETLPPMDVGALWRKGGRSKMGPHWKGGKGIGKLMKGKGRGKWSSFGMKKQRDAEGQPPFDPLKGKGKSGSGKSAPTATKGKGKERPRCWKCGQHRSSDVWRLELRWVLWLLPRLILAWRLWLVDWWLVWQLDLGDRCLLPLCLQHRHRLSLDHRPSTAMSSAGFTEGRTASSAQKHCTECFQLSHPTVKVHWCWGLVRHTLMSDPDPQALVLHSLCTKDLEQCWIHLVGLRDYH